MGKAGLPRGAATHVIRTKSFYWSLRFLTCKTETIIPPSGSCCEDKMKDSMLKNSMGTQYSVNHIAQHLLFTTHSPSHI